MRVWNRVGRLGFSSIPHKKSSEPQVIEETLINPERLRDLRGYEHLNDQPQQYIQFLYLHSKKEQPWRTYNFFKLLPVSFVKGLVTLCNPAYTAVPSDSLHFPKIYPNGVPLYDSPCYSIYFSFMRKILITMGTFGVCLSPVSSIAFLFFGIFLLKYGVPSIPTQAWFKRYNEVVFKMEIIPETRQIAYQKISILGAIKTTKINIADLQFQELSKQDHNDDDNDDRTSRLLLNNGLTFKNKITNEYFRFDKNGYWNEDGVNHPLLD